jgi:uncharacterized Tic20 family protein
MSKGGITMAAMEEKDARTWAMFCHIGAFAGYIIPFGNIIAPLIIWLIKKAESPLVDDQGKESLNFQISITIYAFVALLLTLILIGYILFVALMIFDLVMVIIAAVQVNSGEKYRYPLCIRFIK